MYEFHGWFDISESADESDAGTLADGVEQLHAMIDALQWPTAAATLRNFNGAHVLNVDGLVNRRRYEADELDALLDHITKRFPGSYGLLYDRSDNDPTFPGGPNAFRVRVMARGQLTTQQDPFLSPIQPVIED
jgi:Immunity protein 7